MKSGRQTKVSARQNVPASYKIDKDKRLVQMKAWGVLTFADAVAHRDKLLADPDFDPSFSQISDFTEVTQVAISADELRRLAGLEVFAPQARRAFIAPDDEKFGLGRMFVAHREQRGESGIAVFRSMEEALLWLFPEGR